MMTHYSIRKLSTSHLGHLPYLNLSNTSCILGTHQPTLKAPTHPSIPSAQYLRRPNNNFQFTSTTKNQTPENHTTWAANPPEKPTTAPNQKKGNCGKNHYSPDGIQYCGVHEAYCSRPGHTAIFLKSQGCPNCAAERGERR